MQSSPQLVLLCAVLMPLVQSWILPVSSPIMSLPTIETSSGAFPTSSSSSSSSALNATTAAAAIGALEQNSAYVTPQYPPSSVLWQPSSTALEDTQDSSRKQQQQKRRVVFCDLDGVLVDFEKGVRRLLPPELDSQMKLPQLADLEKSQLWETVESSQDAFFQNLGWTQEGPALWQAIQHLQPDILTGIPLRLPSSRQEKFEWCRQHLTFHKNGVSAAGAHSQEEQPQRRLQHVDKAGPFHLHVPFSFAHIDHDEHGIEDSSSSTCCRVITCWSSNKHFESGPGHVLIDDRLELKDAWVQKGGIFIHHETGNLEGTLQQLQEHGLLLREDEDSCS